MRAFIAVDPIAESAIASGILIDRDDFRLMKIDNGQTIDHLECLAKFGRDIALTTIICSNFNGIKALEVSADIDLWAEYNSNFAEVNHLTQHGNIGVTIGTNEISKLDLAVNAQEMLADHKVSIDANTNTFELAKQLRNYVSSEDMKMLPMSVHPIITGKLSGSDEFAIVLQLLLASVRKDMYEKFPNKSH